MKQTVLHQAHLQLKAKMADTQGWQMPLQYAGVSEEYYAVRTAVGLFDVGHLGRIEITGTGATELLQSTFTRDIADLPEGVARYGIFCDEAGHILDTSLLFHLPAGQGESRYLVTTESQNTDKIFSWLKQHTGTNAVLNDMTDSLSQIALQGPRADLVLDKLSSTQIKKIKPKKMRELALLDTPVMASRTGYTGELGYELFVQPDHAEALWKGILKTGAEFGILPSGIAARDLLRLEAGYLMYGVDVDETRTPLEAGLGSIVDLKKDFIGKEALVKLKADGVEQTLAGFALLEKGIPRSGGSIFSENREIGTVTSANHSPHLRSGIGLGYVISRYAQPGQEVEIEVRDREIAAKFVDLPFYKKK